MRIAIVGSGYVGLVAGVCFAEIGHSVVVVDNDESKIAKLKAGQATIHEENLPGLLVRHLQSKRLSFSTSVSEAMRGTSAVFIAVGTPPKHTGEADLSYVEAVVREIAQHISDYVVVVEKSTVPVLTHDWIRKVMMLNGARNDSFDVVSNPEFLREGTAVCDFLYPDRIVVGANTERAATVIRKIYEPLTSGAYFQNADKVPSPRDNSDRKCQMIVTSAKSAELIKHASNAFLATKISFINAVAALCESLGADIAEVCAGMGADSRIGSRFLNAGIGYGGSCFPKDLSAFHSVARECGYDFALLDEVVAINEQQRQRFVRKVRSALWNIKGKRLGVLGLAFKGGTDDIRESPAVAIVKALLAEGASIQVFDPAAMERAKEEFGTSITFCASSYEVCDGADALLILTDWREFAALDLSRVKSLLRYPIVLDGRNLYDPERMKEAGIQYYSVGRVPVESLTKVSAQFSGQ